MPSLADEVWAERFPDWREVLLEQAMPPPASNPGSNPHCWALVHFTREDPDCICAVTDEAARKARMRVMRRRRHERATRGTPSLWRADWRTATAIVQGYPMRGAARADLRMAAIMLHRKGWSTHAIARRLGRKERTINRWTARTDHLRLTGPGGIGRPRNRLESMARGRH